MHIAFDSCKNHCAVVAYFAGLLTTSINLFLLHEWSQVANCTFHYSGTLNNLGQEHLAAAEVVTHN